MRFLIPVVLVVFAPLTAFGQQLDAGFGVYFVLPTFDETMEFHQLGASTQPVRAAEFFHLRVTEADYVTNGSSTVWMQLWFIVGEQHEAWLLANGQHWSQPGAASRSIIFSWSTQGWAGVAWRGTGTYFGRFYGNPTAHLWRDVMVDGVVKRLWYIDQQGGSAMIPYIHRFSAYASTAVSGYEPVGSFVVTTSLEKMQTAVSTGEYVVTQTMEPFLAPDSHDPLDWSNRQFDDAGDSVGTAEDWRDWVEGSLENGGWQENIMAGSDIPDASPRSMQITVPVPYGADWSFDLNPLGSRSGLALTMKNRIEPLRNMCRQFLLLLLYGMACRRVLALLLDDKTLATGDDDDEQGGK